MSRLQYNEDYNAIFNEELNVVLSNAELPTNYKVSETVVGIFNTCPQTFEALLGPNGVLDKYLLETDCSQEEREYIIEAISKLL